MTRGECRLTITVMMPLGPRMHSRRQFLAQAGGGFGALALASLLSDETAAAASSPADGPKPPHFSPRVKRVIWLFMHGGPSHVDLFDPKPDLIKLAGQPLPE